MLNFSSLKQRLFGKWSLQSKTNFRNSFWGGLDYVVTAGSVFLLIPVLLKTIGQEMFGIMVIVNSVMGFSGLVSFGLGQATLKYVAEYNSKNEIQLVKDVICTTLNFYLLLGVVCASALFFASEWLAVSVFSISPANEATAILSLQLGSVGFFTFLVSSVGENVWKAFERFDVPVIVRSVARALTLVAQIILALLGFSLAWLVVVQVLATAIASILILILIRRYLIADYKLISWPQNKVFKKIFSYGVFTYIAGLFGMMQEHGMNFVIASVLGPSMLALYIIPIRLLSQAHGLVGRLYGFLFPYVSKIHAREEFAELLNCYRKSTLQVSTLSICTIGVISIAAYPLLEIWLGLDVSLQVAGLLQIIAFRFIVYPLSVINSAFLMGTGKVKVIAGMTFITPLVFLPSLFFLSSSYGIWGAAAAQITHLIPVIIYRYVVERALFKNNFSMYRVFLPPTLLVLVAMVFVFISF